MRLQWFEIRGYKNIRTPLRLENLGRVNVLHGDNNVGKSNLLESIGLLFVLLQALLKDVRGELSRAESFERRARPESMPGAGAAVLSTVRSFAYFTERGFPPEEIFNLHEVAPIEIRASMSLGPGELDAEEPAWLAEPLDFSLRLERREDELLIQLCRLQRSDGTDVAQVTGETNEVGLVLERFSRRRRGRVPEPRFALLRADRTILGAATSGVEMQAPLATREPLPRDLGLALYDAEGADDPLVRQRFELFVSALGRFDEILGQGQWRMRYDRRTDRAELLLEAESGRIPLRLMGSGAQQLVSLTARLALTSADIVAIEEPELNLRYLAQLRLRELLNELADSNLGASQILLTSHSPAFEAEEMFYAMRRSPSGPIIERRPREQARSFTLPEVEVPTSSASAPLSYVTTEGLVLVPEDVRGTLGLEHGGGVVFVRERDTGHYRMLTNDQFLDMLEPQEQKP